MTPFPTQCANRAAAVLLMLLFFCAALPSQQSGYTLHSQSDLVLVNVTVRDKSGKFIPGLKPDNFTILEDNKRQKIVSFDVEDVDAVPALDVAQAKAQPEWTTGAAMPAAADTPTQLASEFKNRRLIVLFFDLSAMEPDEIDHAVTSAEH
ncbi:MAG: hypothetical protein WBV69_15755, partial [Candidatus Sulfotelmatobacter sp.]